MKLSVTGKAGSLSPTPNRNTISWISWTSEYKSSKPIETGLCVPSSYRWLGPLICSSSFFYLLLRFAICDLPFSSLLLSKANSTSTGQLDKLVSPALSGLTPESEEERSLPPQRVSTFRPRPYSMADSNKVRSQNPKGIGAKRSTATYNFSSFHHRSPQTCPLLHHLQPGNFRDPCSTSSTSLR